MRRCPLLLTGRTGHLQYFAAKLAGVAKHVFVLRAVWEKQRRETAAALAAVPENESRVILATGSYIGEGFDDVRVSPSACSSCSSTIRDARRASAFFLSAVPMDCRGTRLPLGVFPTIQNGHSHANQNRRSFTVTRPFADVEFLEMTLEKDLRVVSQHALIVSRLIGTPVKSHL